jgi:tetratricopeptide (TPR) repeat protein
MNLLPLRFLPLLLLLASRLPGDFISGMKAVPASPAGEAFVRGAKFLEESKLNEAEKVFAEMVRADPNQALGYVGLADVSFRRRQFPAAETNLRKARSLAPDNLGIAEAFARFLFDMGRFQEAEPAVWDAIKLDPRSGRLRIVLGDTLQRMNRSKEAEAAYREGIKLLPEHGGARFGLGLALQSQGHLAAAESEFRAAAKLAPDNPAPLQALGELLLLRKNPDGALRQFDAAIERSPAYAPPYLSRGDLHFSKRAYGSALADYERAAALLPKSPIPLVKAGMAAQAQKDWTAASRHYRAAIAVDPRFAIAHNNLASIAIETRNGLPAAIQSARKAVELAPRNHAFLDTLGWLLYLSGDPKSAIVPLRSAAEAGDAPASTHYHLGVAAERLGAKAEAKAAFAKAIQTDPKFPEAEDARKRLSAVSQ